MTRDEQVEHVRDFMQRIGSTMLNKGDDYANEDRLSNFKLAGNITGIGASLNCLNLIATKVARLGVLLNSDVEPNYEGVRDSVLDLAVYAILLDQILEDENKVDSEGAG
jgi:hypothetical protein